eukprot:m.211553 g.211553  ORF g.211553 m.211553 type:complete len:351 (+) comp25548_c0_seq1:130-1182(+)
MATTDGHAADLYAVDLSQPRYNLDTYWGRVRHFAEVTDMRLALATNEELYAAKDLLQAHASGAALPPGTSLDDLYTAKRLYESAFHPQSGELMWRFGRMSFAAPGNTIVGAGMLTFYQSTPAVIFWHVANQSFNAILNFVNRNTSSAQSTSQITTSFVVATSSATSVALGLNRAVSAHPALAAGLVGRLVPFAAVAVANCINIPLIRRQELVQGIALETRDGTPITLPLQHDAATGTDGTLQPVRSTKAAQWAIGTTTFSRVAMAVPGMVAPPLIFTQLNRRTNFMKRFPRAEMPVQLLLAGLGVAFAVPFACALFPQQSVLDPSALEPQAQEQLRVAKHEGPVYFNKGL